MTDDKITISRKEERIYEVNVHEIPDYVDDLEEWAKDNALINTTAAERVDTKYGKPN